MKKICMFLVLCLMATFAYGQGNSDRILIVAIGNDEDIPGATTFITGRIEFEESQLPLGLGRVKFRTKIYDEVTGEKVYTIEGEFDDATAIPGQQFYCDVRNVMWVDLWQVVGPGRVKTTDTDMTIVYRGETITLPNTGGKYEPAMIVMVVSPLGENLEGEPYPGWAAAKVFTLGGLFGGVTYLTKYLDLRVP